MDKEGLLSSSAGVTWQVSKSQVLGSPSAAVQINTHRILELDVYRMMIGQTDVRYFINDLWNYSRTSVLLNSLLDASLSPVVNYPTA